MNRRAQRAEERGVVTVFFVMVFFGFFALLGLVVDIGFAYFSQDQLQAASDVASLEGLRFRNYNKERGRRREVIRRALASEIAGVIFDDDLYFEDVDAYDDPLNLGAGPVWDLSHDRRSIKPNEESKTFKPRAAGWSLEKPLGLELNEVNYRHGDLVSGNFLGIENPVVGRNETHKYVRDDFVPAPEGSRRLSRESPSFLARLRRTPNRYYLDRIPGTSSGGPSIPFTFAQGSLIPWDNELGFPDPSGGNPRPNDPDDPRGGGAGGGVDIGTDGDDIFVSPIPYSPRTHGLSVRGTAISHLRPVLVVGNGNRDLDLRGSVPFVIDRHAWNILLRGTPRRSLMDPTGRMSPIPDVSGEIVARFCVPPTRVGEIPQWRTAPGATDLPIPDKDGAVYWKGFVGILETINGVPRVIGFGRAIIALDPDAGPQDTSPFQMAMVRRRTGVAPDNATAIPVSGFPGMTADDLRGLLDSQATLVEPMMAPVLAR